VSEQYQESQAGAPFDFEALRPVTLQIELSHWHFQFLRDWLAYDGLLLGVETPKQAVERFLARALTAAILEAGWSMPTREGVSGFPEGGALPGIGLPPWDEDDESEPCCGDDEWDGEDVPF
jgi:hypothetical protein